MLVLCQFDHVITLRYPDNRDLKQDAREYKVVEVTMVSHAAIDQALVAAGFAEVRLKSYLPNTTNPGQKMWNGERMKAQGEGGSKSVI